MGERMDGKLVAKALREAVGARVERLAADGIVPGLAVVLVGDDPASQLYVGRKEKACARVGIRSWTHRLPSTASQADVLGVLAGLNADPDVHGILVQLPIPGHLDTEAVLGAVTTEKDVDGFHPVNAGRLASGLAATAPCTPRGIMTMLAHYGVNLVGAEAVVIGRSRIVGRPMAALLTAAHATVTVCHSRTTDLRAHAARADVLVVAVGRPEMVAADWVKPGAVVVDVGINRLDDGRLVGDVDFEAVQGHAALVTPVPGGVGPMTIAALLANTCDLAAAAGLTPVERDL